MVTQRTISPPLMNNIDIQNIICNEHLRASREVSGFEDCGEAETPTLTAKKSSCLDMELTVSVRSFKEDPQISRLSEKLKAFKQKEKIL